MEKNLYKESSILEKDQVIWVQNKNMGNKWLKRTFVKFTDDKNHVMCYIQHGRDIYYDEPLQIWDNYSIYNPEHG